MIPGPIEFENQVLQSMSSPTPSHTDPDFISTFHNSLKLMKKTWQCPSGQAFIIAGTGTFAMEMAAANIVEQGDKVLVISTGYFGLRYADILKRYGAKVDILESATGDIVPLESIDQQLKYKSYKLLCFTHVDTSTAVLNDAKSIGELAQKHQVLSIMDAVCSVAGEEIKQEEWGLDIVVSASQKAIGIPPGLALLVASPKAIQVFEQRKNQVQNYYADWANWLPVMKAYENKEASYFATPPVNLIIALEKSLEIILDEGLDKRFERHQKVGKAMRSALKALGLKLVSKNDVISANTLSAAFYPDLMNAATFLKTIIEQCVVLARGLLLNLKDKYFRIGHMGSINQNDLLSTVGAIEKTLNKNHSQHDIGAGSKQILELY